MVLSQQISAVPLLICSLLFLVDYQILSVESSAVPSGFEAFGNFGGFQGFHQFHGWLSSALADNTGSQTRGFPAGYDHLALDDYDGDNGVFSQRTSNDQEKSDIKQYQISSKPRDSRKNISKHSQDNVNSKNLSNAQQYQFATKPYVSSKIVHQPPPVHVHSKKLKTVKQYQPSQYANMKNTHQIPQIHTNPNVLKQPNTKLYQATSKPPERAKKIYQPPHIQAKPQKPSTATIKPLHRPDYQDTPSYAGNLRVFKPIPPRQDQSKSPKYVATSRSRTTPTGKSNVAYIYGNPHQQTLAAIDPSYRGVLKLESPMEHRRNYLSYTSTYSSHAF